MRAPNPPRVLCIDDNVQILRLMSAYLEARGYEVLTTSSGTEALEILNRTAPFYAVVIDCEMPEMTGTEICFRMRLERPEIPIIMFSGVADPSAPALRSVDIFLNKNEGMAALARALERVGRLPRPAHWPIRRFRRYAVAWPLEVRVARAGGALQLNGTAIDVSEGGIAGRLLQELLRDEDVSIAISDPQTAGVSLPCRARVRHRTSGVYGFQFVDLTAGQQQAVKDLCHRLDVSLPQ
jgi:CheY-like chemotaxis protein